METSDYRAMQARFREPEQRAEILAAFANGTTTFLEGALPSEVMKQSPRDVLGLLSVRLGAEVVEAATDPVRCGRGWTTGELPEPLRSPVAGCEDGGWIRTANVVGVNVRTLGSFWDVVVYSLTLPRLQSALHMLPIWETGVVRSLYGMSSWDINPEFFSEELRRTCPGLDTVEKQLAAVIHLLHGMGRTVGMDVIPHTDRYSEMALANPWLFEWLRRDDTTIVDHRADLHEAVEREVLAFLAARGPAEDWGVLPRQRSQFFAGDVEESHRRRLLFGSREHDEGRLERRIQLVQHLHAKGYETVPATMGPPYRGLRVDTRKEALLTDHLGMTWREYEIEHPGPMSRVFGPLTRYKLYERVDDNRGWGIDFERPRPSVWDYIRMHYADTQRRYGFDFMRGDMSHVQMRPGGVPSRIDEHYDPLRAVKREIRERRGVRAFAYFAETFLAPPDTMAFGEEVSHLEACEAEVTLGDLQSCEVGSREFAERARQYLDIASCRRVTPSFTVMTADKDDPRFDGLYVRGNEARLFLALFSLDLPSYMSLGFEVRDPHVRPATNEHYSKLYVFQEATGPKATQGPYEWGRNAELFRAVTDLRRHAEEIAAEIGKAKTRWLIPPDPAMHGRVWAWTQCGDARYVFVVHVRCDARSSRFALPQFGAGEALGLLYTTAERGSGRDDRVESNGYHYPVEGMDPGEARIYRVGSRRRKPGSSVGSQTPSHRQVLRK